ncbi:hypothetical protein ABHF33_13460 [Chitinibacter sp. FCG-7]|uniref:Uncharacterized protein n=1 Tax=Chitinibacter mangrovi TaxID=3153927 RepID=A0AAU7F7I2_9NEIS
MAMPIEINSKIALQLGGCFGRVAKFWQRKDEGRNLMVSCLSFFNHPHRHSA